MVFAACSDVMHHAILLGRSKPLDWPNSLQAPDNRHQFERVCLTRLLGYDFFSALQVRLQRIVQEYAAMLPTLPKTASRYWCGLR